MYTSVRLTVREALTDYGIGADAKPKATSVSRTNLLIPRPVRLSLRNAFRRKARLALTLITLVLAGAIFISVYNLWASFYKVIDDFQGYYLSDINIGFNRAYRFSKVATIAESVSGVEQVEGWLEFNGTVIRNKEDKGIQVAFVAPPSTSNLIKPIISSGRWLSPGDENAVVVGNYFLRVFPESKLGDWLTIEIDGKESKWQIIGVYSFMQTGGNPLIYVNYEYISRLTNQTSEVYSLRIITNSHDITTQRRVNDQLRALYAAYGIRVGASLLGAEEIQRLSGLFDIFAYFFLAMATLIAIIGGLGLMSLMSINVLERTREIGVMRAIGASNWDIQSIVIVEGMVIGLISWFISILLAIPITAVLTTGVGVLLFSNPLQVVYGWTGIIAWLIGILIIGTLASALPAQRASRLTVRDTLAYE
jgi:putative ABC transport system permease protein